MNITSLSRFVPALLVATALALLLGTSMIARSHSASARYKECSELAASQPALAMQKAKAWRAVNPTSPIARHCEALALYGLKHYSDAADALLALSKESSAHTPALSVHLLLQASSAYALGGQLTTALHTISDRLQSKDSALTPAQKADLLIARARLYRSLKQPLKAIDDLDAALQMAPDSPEAKTLHTEIYGKNSDSKTGH